ncbi:MAG: response regulator transcription factor [Nocardioidaceae bacterium]
MRILVVDDDVSLADALRRGLQREGYAVDVAHDGADGQWLAEEHDYDVLVLDEMLPGRSGTEVCRRLRAAERWTPILVLTARSCAREEAGALDSGADDFLAKPFSFPVLLARLRALVRRGATPRPGILRAGDLALDPAAHAVHRGDVPVPLTPRQFQLLELLLRHPGEVLSKTRIMEHVWDLGFEGDPNIVEVYVRQLRQRVDEPFGRHALETVRGVGYRLDPAGG